jgi:deoxyribonuclease V
MPGQGFAALVNKNDLVKIQEDLASKVIIPPDGSGYQPRTGDVIFGLDAQYVDNQAYVGLDVQKWHGETIGTFVGYTVVSMPYIPHFFCFREGPPLLKMIMAAKDAMALEPALIIIDGHGVAHPIRFGLACWIGVHTDTPTIGCAKEALIWYDGEIKKEKGNTLWIEDRNEVVGSVLVTQDNTNPVFVSSGHRISLRAATKTILHLSETYRICEPLRRADSSARAYARGMVLKNVSPMGELDVYPNVKENDIFTNC